MATDAWVNETLYAEWGQRFLVKRELARVQSDFQDIKIYESDTHGRVMLLDGVVDHRGGQFVLEMLAACRCAWRLRTRLDHRRR